MADSATDIRHVLSMLFPRFGIWRRKEPEVLDHKFQCIDGFECSTAEFYRAIQDELTQREVPGLEVSEEEHAEGDCFQRSACICV